MVIVELAGASHARGAVNEDAYLIDAEHCIFGVFDGLGASAQSALASRLAAAAIGDAYRLGSPEGGPAEERSFLAAVVGGAGALLAATLADGLTTASVVKVCDRPGASASAVVGHVGDSRVYRSTSAGELHQCTLDDSVFGRDWDLQLRLGEVVAPTDMLEHAYFQLRHVMDRALGDGLGGAPRMWELTVDEGDVLVAVTDGVTDNLTFSELRQQLGGDAADRDDPARLAGRLVDAAVALSREQGHPRAKPDDTTAVVAVVRGVGESGRQDVRAATVP